MDKTYMSRHKCRLCGEVYVSGSVTSRGNAFNDIVRIAVDVPRDPQAPTMLSYHECEGKFSGCIGLSDFIGWVPQIPKEK